MGCNSSKSAQPYQPRPKDIPIELDAGEGSTGKDERDTTDNAKDIGEVKWGIFTKGLEEFLERYEGHAKQPGNQDPKSKLIVKKGQQTNCSTR